MKNARWLAPLCVLFVAMLSVCIVGCGGSGTPTPPATPVAPVVTIPTVSAVEIIQAFDTDLNKAQADYKGKTIKLVNVIADTHWEDDKMLTVAPFKPETNEAGGVSSSSFFRGAQLKQMVSPFFFKVRIDDPKLIEGIRCTNTTTEGETVKTEYFDLLEIECEFDSFTEGEIIFKNPKITKK